VLYCSYGNHLCDALLPGALPCASSATDWTSSCNYRRFDANRELLFVVLTYD
jgi:hypothetical protein